MRVIILFFGLIVALGGIAQTHLIGIEAGPTFAQTEKKDYNHYNILPASSANAFYEFKNRNFTSTFGLGYLNKGFQQELIYVNEIGNVLGEGALERVRHNYLSVSEIVGIEYGEKLFGFTGVGLRASMYSNTIVSGAPFPLNDGTTVQGYRWELDYLNWIDLSALARIGGGIKTKKDNIFYLSATYDFGLTKIYESETPSKHRNLTILIGFKRVIEPPFVKDKSISKKA